MTKARSARIYKVALWLVAVPLMWGRLPASYLAYAAVNVLPIVCRESLVTPQESSARYLLTVFPVFALLALAGRRAWVDRLVLVTFPVLLGALVAHFAHFAQHHRFAHLAHLAHLARGECLEACPDVARRSGAGTPRRDQ